MQSESELAAERAVVARAQARHEAIRAEASAVSREVLTAGAGGLKQDRLERDVRVTYSRRRLAMLNIGRDPIILGRTDGGDGVTHRVGRVAVDDENRDPLVIDWRAPAAEPFYRATPLSPMGLIRRRHYQYRAGDLVGMEDELFDREQAASEGLVLVGEGALMAALGRRRTGRMASIVATIQREQDVIIRAPLGGVLVVQGGPGTGKTAVALHRAAFLLYTHRFPLETTGVLVLGPNPRFLGYIEDVLPSLGEHAVTLATPANLVPDIAVTGRDDRAAARIKGDLRMIQVLEQTIARLCRPLAQELVVPSGATRLVLTVEASRRIIARVRRMQGTHHQRRRQVERLLVEHLRREEISARRRLVVAGRIGPEAAEPARVQGSGRVWLQTKPVRAALQRMWPVLTPGQVVSALLTSPALRRRASAGILDEDETAAIARERPPGAGEPEWTAADAALIEEASLLLGAPPGAGAERQRDRTRPSPDERQAAAELIDRLFADQVPECPHCTSPLDWRPRERRWVCLHPQCDRSFEPEQVLSPQQQHLFESVLDHVVGGTGRGEEVVEDLAPGANRIFGHVVVDEAQDLSPLQWRMLARRCPSRSMTVAGDLDQASGSWAPATWGEALAPALHDAPGVPVEEVDLTVNYRTPEEVMDVAGRVLALASPSRTTPVSARRCGVAPDLVTVTDQADVSDAVAVAVRSRAQHVPGGLLAVIAPATMQSGLDAGLDGAAVVLSLDEAKGLEFDGVVVCEPAALVAEHPHGMAALYVALTRTTHFLTVVASAPLPADLRAAFAN